MPEENSNDEFPKIDVSLEQDGGILKQILHEGEGEEKPLNGDTVSVHYVGCLDDGTEFDSSRSRGERFTFELGKGAVIKAWDQGVATMKKGEIARFTCQPEYAYGETGSLPKIPANATLVFEVELFDWKGEDVSEDKDGSIIRSVIKKGEKYSNPNDGATVKVKYTASYNGNVFEKERELEFIVGEGDEQGIIPGLEQAVKKMKQHEKSKFDIKPSQAYGAKGNTEFNIPGEATLVYEVELLSFEKAKESWEFSTEEKLEQSEIAKNRGTHYFKKENYSKAKQFYKKVKKYLEYETDLQEENKEKRNSLMLATHLNIAMCEIKLGDFSEAREECNKALELDPKSVKAHFRRATAYFQVHDHESAKADYEKVLEYEPENKAAKNQIVICEQKLKQFREKEKHIYAGMFNKFAERDSRNVKASDESKTTKEADSKPEESAPMETS
ncbi:peptidyl-prolyl cis-trans isomerase FKBP4-like isoform X3 [Mytilus californianus]|uniref:peptidyl-prolyl cis-trans isomerase FKBP4-like isoform X3 n=1 Tax=Mytilus californianus TaxID=6549 RepID=UPI00224729B4|nr:peptidyl-prolyl cis-trans isomerase FKBP4-like isoform X3 [Mytilus californianus]